MSFIETLSDATLRSAALLALVAIAVPLILGRSSAARRHLLWSIALLACIGMPLFRHVLPRWEAIPPAAIPSLSIVQTPVAPVTPVMQEAAVEHTAMAPAADESAVSARPQPLNWHRIIAVVWTIGFAAMLLPIMVGRLLLVRLMGASRSFAHVRSTVVPVLTSSRCHMPMTFGIIRPRILLPEDAEFWEAGRLDAVLAHELAHIGRLDCLWQTLAQVVRAVYWFNPLAWYAYRRVVIESERACDDAVLQDGAASTSYADHLLSIATAGRSDALLSAAAIAMARSTTLEGRLLSILDTARNRQRVTLTIAAATIILIAGIAVPLATLRAQSPAGQTAQPTAEVPTTSPSAMPAPTSTVPAIVTSTPQVMQTDVDPALDRIEVTFDQPMTDKSWSWTGGGETYPELRGKPSYDARRLTCTMPVKLQPGKVYWVGINSPSYRNFVSEKGTPADWYIILFATRSADGKPTPVPQDMQQRAKAINMRKDGTKPSSQSVPPVADIQLKLVKEIRSLDWPVYTALPGSFPAFAWDIPAEMRDAIGYVGFVVTPILRPDVKNIQPSDMWQAMNEPDRMSWFVMGMPGNTARVRYAAAPASEDVLTSRTGKSLTEGFYMVMVSGYSGKYNPAEGRQGVLVGGCVLRIGNPAEPPKLDTSSLTPATMKPRLQQYVESFFKSNYRDITARKTLEWGDAIKEADGNWTIRYKCEATIWNKDKVTQDKLFTFTPEGGFVKAKDAPKAP